jgi:hypothetical protein
MTSKKVEALIQRHIERYAQIDILDIYKLLHQALFGPGHPITNRKATEEWLVRQSEILQPLSGQPLLESVHPEDAVVRLHLRPYLELNGNLKKLLETLIESSQIITGDLETMASWWKIFQRMTDDSGSLARRFDRRTVALIGRTRAEESWPASHHSPAFDFTYKPVYRVLSRPLAEKLLQDQKLNLNLV